VGAFEAALEATKEAGETQASVAAWAASLLKYTVRGEGALHDVWEAASDACCTYHPIDMNIDPDEARWQLAQILELS